MERITKAVEKARQNATYGAPLDPIPGMARIGSGRKAQAVVLDEELLKTNHIINGGSADEKVQSYKVLRTQVWHRLRDNGWSTMGITSVNPDAGKTLTSINLAISLASMDIGKTIVLVDLDLRRPKIHHYLGIRSKYSLLDYLHDDVALPDIMIDPGIGIESGVGKIIIIPCLQAIANSSEVLSSHRIKRLLVDLKKLFPSRLVLFDLPPVLAADDVLVVSNIVESMLIVVEEGKTRADELRKTVGLLKNTQLVGTVLNKSTVSSQPYGYY